MSKPAFDAGLSLAWIDPAGNVHLVSGDHITFAKDWLWTHREDPAVVQLEHDRMTCNIHTLDLNNSNALVRFGWIRVINTLCHEWIAGTSQEAKEALARLLAQKAQAYLRLHPETDAEDWLIETYILDRESGSWGEYDRLYDFLFGIAGKAVADSMYPEM